MPKVSQDYKDARRDQILTAAKRCFVRQGFHETSMQDLFAESGLSSGAVYRYFRSKSDVVMAIAEANMDQVLTLVRDVTKQRDAGLGSALAALFDTVRERDDQEGLGAVAVLVWSEALRNPAIAERVRDFLDAVTAELTALVEDQQTAGRIPASLEPAATARLIASLVPGSIMQLALYGSRPMSDAASIVHALWPASDAD